MTTIEELRRLAPCDNQHFVKDLMFQAADEIESLQRVNDQNAHDFKQLRCALNCDGSDLPQLLSAIEALQKENEQLKRDKERLDWLEINSVEFAYREKRLRSAIDAAMMKVKL